MSSSSKISDESKVIDDDDFGNLFGNTYSEENSKDEEVIIKFDEYYRQVSKETTDMDSRLNMDYCNGDSTSNNESTKAPSCLRLALVSKHHSLWAEYVYNAARILADKIDCGEINCFDKKCLELGAGAGLPGLICALNGSSEVVISDYGNAQDYSLIYAIDINIKMVLPYCSTDKVFGVNYIWGNPVESLLDPLHNYQSVTSNGIQTDSFDQYKQSKLLNSLELPPTQYYLSYFTPTSEQNKMIISDESNKFDIILLADLIFNRSEHEKLLWTVKYCLKHEIGKCYVSFSHHDPLKKELDLNFFRLAKSEKFRFEVTFLEEQKRQSYPFTEKDGLDDERGIVYLYLMELPKHA
eukprot:gene3953-5669_t